MILVRGSNTARVTLGVRAKDRTVRVQAGAFTVAGADYELTDDTEFEVPEDFDGQVIVYLARDTQEPEEGVFVLLEQVLRGARATDPTLDGRLELLWVLARVDASTERLMLHVDHVVPFDELHAPDRESTEEGSPA